MGGRYSVPVVEDKLLLPEFIQSLPRLDKKVVVITGTSAGSVGFHAARVFLERGACVICLNRDPSKSAELAGEGVVHLETDLASLSSTRRAAQKVKALLSRNAPTRKIDLLCLNAGVMMLPSTQTEDGFDIQMQTNHLSHFLLTALLFEYLSDDARIVTQTSEARNTPPKHLEGKYFEANLEPGQLGNDLGLGRATRYQQSKLACCVFTYALRDRLLERGSGIKALLVHPGISASNLAKTASDSASPAFALVARLINTQAQSAADGAVPLIMAALNADPPVFSGPTEGIALLRMNFIRGMPHPIEPEPALFSEESKRLLWLKSCQAVGVQDFLLTKEEQEAAGAVEEEEAVVCVMNNKCRFVDLGHSLDTSSIFWPDGEGFSLCMHTSGQSPLEGDDTFYAAGTFECAEHGGTHVDAPYHFSQGGKTVDQIHLRELVAVCRVVVAEGSEDANNNITVDSLLAHEKRNGRVPRGSVVLCRTKWGRRYTLGSKDYLGYDAATDGAFDPEKTVLSFPGITAEAALLLVKRGVVGVGIDTASLDPGACKSFDAHRILLSNSIYGIENISSALASVPEKGATVMVMPLKITGGSGAPARVVAICPSQPSP